MLFFKKGPSDCNLKIMCLTSPVLCCAELPSCVWLFATPWIVACQSPLSMEFSRQEYWSGFLCPAPGDLLTPGIEPRSASLQADFFTVWAIRGAQEYWTFPDSGIEPGSPALQADSLPAGLPGKDIREFLIFQSFEQVVIICLSLFFSFSQFYKCKMYCKEWRIWI